METVSLELDDDSKSPEGMIIIDTVAFEQEAELIEVYRDNLLYVF